MGLRTELASGDAIDWTQQGMVKSSTGGVGITDQPVRPPQQQQKQRHAAGQQQQQQQGPHLRCPRCNSTNTKFCYYNNYSRVQPRHLCKACRRHWTEGGTLRNVPVGGGRKAKRPKTSHPSSADPAAADDANAVMPATSAQLLPPLSFPQDHLLSPPLLPSSLPPLSAYANTGYLSALLSLPLTPRAAGVVDGAGGCSFSASTTFSPFLSLAGQEDLAAGIASDTGIAAGSTATPPPPPLWELLPPPGPPTCSGGAGGSSVTTASSGLTALDSSSSPSSGYWSSCWDDLSSFLSIDLEQHPPPAGADAPPPHLHNFELS
ncbi:hypothetical protein Taro_026451 [Colocasia esculenta]|uniref:Dof zinc finger protein n=1 Tax=Colocasia esculenta TaxID=4460 RepID=A0A843VNL8_COLES|nr:hypothetical protein [Colocasia esculenta]